MSEKTKVYVKVEQNARQADMLRTQFIQTRSGETTTARKIAALCQELWGIYYDWHDWSNTLEKMAAYSNVEAIDFDDGRMTRYWIA